MSGRMPYGMRADIFMVWGGIGTPERFLLSSGDDERSDPPGTCRLQNSSAFIQCRAGGTDIIDENDVPSGDFVGGCASERVGKIFQTTHPILGLYLRCRVADALERG